MSTAGENSEEFDNVVSDALVDQQAIVQSHTHHFNDDYYVDNEFLLSSGNYNLLITLSNSILSLPPTLRAMDQIEDITSFYENIKNEIYAISEELNNKGYDEAVRLSFRYCLCAYIDEAVMSTTWGEKSSWTERSMLSFFHNETWSGEKFFMIMHRIMREPEVYKDLLEFIYMCLVLGYKGKYAVDPEGPERLNGYIKQIYAKLYPQSEKPENFRLPQTNPGDKKFQLKLFSPISYLWYALIAGVIIYYIYQRTVWNGILSSAYDVLNNIQL